MCKIPQISYNRLVKHLCLTHNRGDEFLWPFGIIQVNDVLSIPTFIPSSATTSSFPLCTILCQRQNLSTEFQVKWVYVKSDYRVRSAIYAAGGIQYRLLSIKKFSKKSNKSLWCQIQMPFFGILVS